jgi:hypothetical protein
MDGQEGAHNRHAGTRLVLDRLMVPAALDSGSGARHEMGSLKSYAVLSVPADKAATEKTHAPENGPAGQPQK